MTVTRHEFIQVFDHMIQRNEKLSQSLSKPLPAKTAGDGGEGDSQEGKDGEKKSSPVKKEKEEKDVKKEASEDDKASSESVKVKEEPKDDKDNADKVWPMCYSNSLKLEDVTERSLRTCALYPY